MGGLQERGGRLRQASVGLLIVGALGVARLAQLDGLSALWWRLGLVLAGIAAVVVGVVAHRPRRRRAWFLLLAGLAASAVGDLLVIVASAPGSIAANLPADAWLTAAGGMLVLLAMLDVTFGVRGRDPGSVLDALLLATAVWTLLWQLLVVPAGGPGWAGSGTVFAGGLQVLLFVAVLALLVRTIRALPVRERTATLLLASALSAAIVAFLLGAIGQTTDGIAHYGGARAIFGAVANLTAGAAALHPSMRALDVRRPTASDGFTAGRSIAVGLALLAPPVVLLVTQLAGAEVALGSLALAWIVLVPAVLARLHLLGAGRDAALLEAAASDRRLRSLVAHTGDLLLIVDPGAQPRIRYASPAATRVLGIPPEHLVGTSALALPTDDPSALRGLLVRDAETLPRSADLPLRHRDGDERWIQVVVDRYVEGSQPGLVLTLSDITDRKQSEMRWVRAAHHDALTGLVNRRGIEERLEQHLGRLATQGGRFGVLLCDLDGFKAVNDTGGHLVGDEVLRHVAARFRRVVRDGDVVARLGGDEFVVLCTSAVDERAVEQVAERIIASLREPIVVNAAAWQVGVSVGMALADGTDASIGRLLRRADVALYQAKGAGKGLARWDAAVLTS